MDVKEIQAAALSGVAGKKIKQDQPEGIDFQNILQQAQSGHKPGGAENSDLFPEGPEVCSLPELSFSSMPSLPGSRGISSVQAEGTLASERALALLDRYRAAMADSSHPLREIRPVVQSLSAELIELNERAGRLSPSDPLLKIMNAIGVLSTVEIEKFNRGDYS